ncbi:MAG: TolC family protein [Polyangiales bacterium]
MLLLTLLFVSNSAWAQRLWSAQDAAQFAVRASPSVQSARWTVASAEATRAFAAVPRVGNPIVSLRLMVGLPDVPAATIGVLAGLPIDLSDRVGAASREARWTVREAHHGLDVAVLDARFRALDAWACLSLAQERVEVTESLARNAQTLADRLAARERERAATELELSLALRDLAVTEADVADARRARAECEARFRDALGLSPTESVRAASAAAITVPDLTREQIAQRAAEQRPERRWLEAGASRAVAQAQRARASAVDPLVVAAEFEWQGYQQSSFGLSFNSTLPLVRRAQGEVSVSIAESVALRARAELARDSAAREAVGAYDALVQRVRALDALTQRAIPAAEAAVRATELLFDQGAVDTFRVLTARRELSTLRLRLVDARLEALRARFTLERAVGGL